MPDNADMLSSTVSQIGDSHYSYDDFAFFNTQEENKKLSRKNSFTSHTVKTRCNFIRSISKWPNIIVVTGGYRGLVGRANIGHWENMDISVSKMAVQFVFKCHHIIMKLPGEYKQDFVIYTLRTPLTMIMSR